MALPPGFLLHCAAPAKLLLVRRRLSRAARRLPAAPLVPPALCFPFAATVALAIGSRPARSPPSPRALPGRPSASRALCARTHRRRGKKFFPARSIGRQNRSISMKPQRRDAMDDERIIDLFFARSEQAIHELDARYGALCRRLSFHIVNDRQDAEECVNDAYLGVWNAIPPARPQPLLSFVAKIVRNISLNAYWKKHAARRGGPGAEALAELSESFPDARSGVEDAVGARELARAIERFLDTLSAENRAIFLRRYWFADPCREIALAVGLSEKAVTVRLVRLRRRLRQYLEEKEGLL